ncbi:MAG: putative transaldolase [Clostridia bacterium]|jgi:fructose-6-phosphate aldolase 2|nr:putative transaldolase [Clostridia bacterium]
MIIMLDTADVQEIKKFTKMYPIDGVTTNPSLVAKQKRNFIELIKEIRETIGDRKMLHVQALGKTAEEIVEEAQYLNTKIGGTLYIKIPVVEEGIKAIMILKEKGIKTTATAVFTPLQALMAAKAGAEYIAPYVNRLDNISADGIKVVSEIVQIFNVHGVDAKVLAASFKNVEQIHKACLAGAHSITAGPDIMNQLLYHPLTNWSVEQFVKAWEDLYGKGKRTDNI